MNSDTKPPSPVETVHCARHGDKRPAFVCAHLLSGTGVGFLTGEVDPTNPYADAWCSDCEQIRLIHGGWENVSDEAYDKVDVRLVCGGCYEEIKAKNSLSATKTDD